MGKPDLRTELCKHRELHGLTAKQMADKFNLPEQVYLSIESGTAKLSAEEEKKIRNLLAQEMLGPPAARKWYSSKAWHLVIPIAICIVVILLISQTTGYSTGSGEADGAEQPVWGLIVMSVIFCSCYWYFWTPVWPFKKGQNPKRSG